MTLLIIGLMLFLGVHSVRIFADPWRSSFIARRGDKAWKSLYSLVAIVGFVLLLWGYSLARQQPVQLWGTAAWTRQFAALLTIPAFVLLAAAYVPANGIKSRVHHPMLLGVKLWALAHLVANNNLADLLLFGSFLAWAVLAFAVARRRDRLAGTEYAQGRSGATALTAAVGVAAWVVFAVWIHAAWLGVRPF